MRREITAVICTCNRPHLLKLALHSLQQQNLEPVLFASLIIDTSMSPVARNLGFRDVEILHRPGFSLAEARNVALERCRTPIIAFIDDDAVACRDWLSQLLRGLDSIGREAACIGGPVEPIWPTEQPHWLPDRMLGYFSVVDWGREAICLDNRRWLGGTNIAYRANRLIDIGGFRVDLGRRGNVLLSNEELETQDRLRAAGYKVFYTPSARVKHHIHPERLDRDWLRKRVFWQAISFAIQHPSLMEQYRPKTIGSSPAKVAEFLLNIDLDSDDPEEVRYQCRGLYDLAMLLARGLGPDED